jgi:hypothetical protein
MNRVITLAGIAALATAAIFVWAQIALAPSQDANTTVGVSQTAPAPQEGAFSPSTFMLKRAAPLPIETWDAH